MPEEYKYLCKVLRKVAQKNPNNQLQFFDVAISEICIRFHGAFIDSLLTSGSILSLLADASMLRCCSTNSLKDISCWETSTGLHLDLCNTRLALTPRNVTPHSLHLAEWRRCLSVGFMDRRNPLHSSGSLTLLFPLKLLISLKSSSISCK